MINLISIKMKENDQLNFSNICRTCMKKLASKRGYSVFDCYTGNGNGTLSGIKIATIIQECMSIQITPNDELPLQICKKCAQLIVQFFQFQNECKIVQQKLEKIHGKPAISKRLLSVKSESPEAENILLTNTESAPLVKVEYKNDWIAEEDPTKGGAGENEAVASNHLVGNSSSKPKKVSKTPKKIKKEHQCKVCNKIFKNAPNLYGHMHLHNGVRPYSCDVCGKKFYHSGHLNGHLLIHTGEKPYPCGVCSKTFRQRSSLHVHERTHTGERPHLCSICGKAFAQKSQRETHMRSHTGERPFKCDICGKGFSRSVNVKVHRRFHTGERPYECKRCGKRYITLEDIKRHNLQHDDIRNFQCKICDRRFHYRTGLKEHLITHTGNRPFKCEECPKSFMRRRHLNNHTLKHIQQQKAVAIGSGSKKLIQGETPVLVEKS